MLRDLSLTVSPLLALLLIVLTPVGTGQGAHRDQLLDPLFPHVHFADGSTLLLRYPQRVVEQRGEGPAIGAGAGAAIASLSAGLTPPTPEWPALRLVGDSMWRIVRLTTLPAGVLAEPPPDPPPTAA
jgi:hypothetical protein